MSSFEMYHRKWLMSDPAEEIIKKFEGVVLEGRIATPYIDFIRSTIFTRMDPILNPRMAVIVPCEDGPDPKVLKEMNLQGPSIGEIFSFCTQIDKKDFEENEVVVFPSNPPITEGIKPVYPSWWTSRVEKNSKSRLLLYRVSRSKWPDKTYMVGIT